MHIDVRNLTNVDVDKPTFFMEGFITLAFYDDKAE